MGSTGEVVSVVFYSTTTKVVAGKLPLRYPELLKVKREEHAIRTNLV